ncbi:MAG: DUF389 domain-containing protein [Deltaproteobacteria bacterium]|nr:DUF389 domain-containing protein [Deltaproteobacteria bacterium]
MPKKNLATFALSRLRERLSLVEDVAKEAEIVAEIRRGVDFRGINLWTLIFAMLIASIGLNVNSTAVIIGAMLISPLMGPIMGVGLGVAIFDFDLVKRAFLNLALAVVFSVTTSFLYFSLSPLSDAQSELLARTTPTLWDVLIAFVGGLAGIVAGSGRDRGNAIPGVAIATALMPPLCTAGYGLATRNGAYFLGAAYLFFINAVMIALSTTLVVRFLRFKPVSQPDEGQRTRVRRTIAAVVVLTVAPSLYLGWRIVQQNAFTRGAKQFVHEELSFSGVYTITSDVSYWPKRAITVLLVGKAVPDNLIENARQHAARYGLEGTDIRIDQGAEATDAAKDAIAQKAESLQGLLRVSEERIKTLEAELVRQKRPEFPLSDIAEELRVQYPTVSSLRVAEVVTTGSSQPTAPSLVVLVDAARPIAEKDRQKILAWLSVRLKAIVVSIVVQVAPPRITSTRNP